MLERIQRHGAIYRPLRAALIGLAGVGAVSREIVDGPLRGYHLVLGPDDRNAYLVNRHERPIVDVLEQLSRPGMRVLDVGAHVGYFTLLLSTLVGPEGRVYALEPNPLNLAKLRAMLAVNGLTNVAVFPVAATDRTGEGEFVTERTGQMGHLALGSCPREAQSLVVVQTARIDDLAREHKIGRIDLIKIDVEGAERQVLHGMAELLAASKPIVICEWHPLVAGSDYVSTFETFGYTCELLEPANTSEPFHLLARRSTAGRRHDE